MLLSLFLLIIGLLLLIKGGDWLVNGASSIARKYSISELVIGLTIVAFGTSAPELVVSSLAAINHHPEIALGNVIGSNNFNLFVILGILGVISPLAVQKTTISIEIPISLAAALILLLLANNFFIGESLVINRLDASILLVCFIAFIRYIWKTIKKEDVKFPFNSNEAIQKPIRSMVLILLGLAGLILGGKWVVNSSVDLARYFNISEKVIGLTIVAMGTSLPELFTSIIAIRKNSADIAIGNVIGSNIFNIFLILGVGGIIRPMEYSIAFNTDLILLIVGSILLLLAMFTGKKRKLDRWEAIILLGIYIVYMVYVGIRN
ncbi:MAG TPA: calcium/sodium antiporter [Marinilabiliaceae bacterium]|nr:calcium/sodium antiporter [Marinilabiliaceae bacterium]